MDIVVTGGSGFLGKGIIKFLLNKSDIGELKNLSITAVDHVTCPIDDPRIEKYVGDISDTDFIKSVFKPETQAVYHLAAIVSGQAEEDFELGIAINLDATRQLLEECRRHPNTIRFIFASSVAVFGPNMPAPLDQNTATQPRSSYGTAKAMAELLINDYSRRGFVDAVICRLPTISVRPGKPNTATTSFASSIIREPLVGKTAICPVNTNLAMWLSSPQTVIYNLGHALFIRGEDIGVYRTINLPGITTTVAEMIETCHVIGGQEAKNLIKFDHDSTIESIVGSFPAEFDTTYALNLGFVQDEDFNDIAQKYKKEFCS